MNKLLKKIRESKGLSQPTLSGKTKIPLRTIRSYEQSERSLTNVKTIFKIANALDVPAYEIVEDKELKEDMKENYKIKQKGLN